MSSVSVISPLFDNFTDVALLTAVTPTLVTWKKIKSVRNIRMTEQTNNRQ